MTNNTNPEEMELATESPIIMPCDVESNLSTSYHEDENKKNSTFGNENESCCCSYNKDTASTTTGSPTQPPMVLHVEKPATKPPKDALLDIYKAGQYKAHLSISVLSIQSIMAGIYIGMAGQLYLSVGGKFLGAALFPTGLIAVLLTSAELFTGDALIFVASLLGGKVTLCKLLRNWTVSWCCNFIGCLLWAVFIGFFSDALDDLNQDDLAVQVALKKANQPWMNIFLKGIGANFMVCLGVWQATCAEEVAGKILALWFPITGFVAMGLDHCIANQFLIPMGMMLGGAADSISVSQLLFEALLPATLGNLVGGGFFVGAVYWYVFDSMGSASERTLGCCCKRRDHAETNRNDATSSTRQESSLQDSAV